MAKPLAFVPERAMAFMDTKNLYQGLLLDLLVQHRLRDRA
jgi:hypothetical protein